MDSKAILESRSRPESGAVCYDNTKLSGYKTCPRYHLLRQVLAWKPSGTAASLVFGQGWHAGQDIIWQYAKQLSQQDLAQAAMLKFMEVWEESGYPSNMTLEQQERLAPRTPGVAGEMFVHYIDARWRMLNECEVIAIEQPFAVPLPQTDGFWYVGRLDKVFSWAGQTLVGEHKSTTAYATIGNFRQDYVDSWYTDSQVKGYEFGASLYFPKLDGVWVDAALVHKKIHNAFKFIPVSHDFQILEEWVGHAAYWAKQVYDQEQAYKQAGELKPGMFPKNENSCFGKYGPCAFINICRTVTDPTKLDGPPDGFEVSPWDPFSMLELDKIIKETE